MNKFKCGKCGAIRYEVDNVVAVKCMECDSLECYGPFKEEKDDGSKVPCSAGLDPSFPTRQDIEAMAKNNPVLYRAIKTAEMLKVQTWAEVLQLAVKCLVEYSDAQNERMIKIVELSGKPFVIE